MKTEAEPFSLTETMRPISGHQSAVTLAYAANNRRSRRWRRVGAVFAIALVAAVIIASFPTMRRLIAAHARISNQRACLEHQWFPRTVVYNWPAERLFLPSDSAATGATYLNAPQWAAFLQLNPQIAFLPTLLGVQQVGTVFLHSLKDKQGNARLVSVQLFALQGNADVVFESSVIEIGTWTKPARIISNFRALRVEVGIKQLPFLVYGGQVDPADQRHLTIDYKAAGIPGVIDGTIDQRGFLTLVPRSGSTAGGIWNPFNVPPAPFGPSEATSPFLHSDGLIHGPPPKSHIAAKRDGAAGS
ncbi:MAG TPA: hypothetical protein VFE47_05190 [Tepidisphaeraceae bacterium]|nr:hypothetical protein [Tepidisphaeraceae bacterium]